MIIAAEVIEHLPRPIIFCRDVYDLLIEGGALILSTPNIIGLWSIFFDRIMRTLHNIIRKLKGLSELRKEHISLFTYNRLLETLSLYFKIKSVKSTGSGIPSILESLGILKPRVITLLNNFDVLFCNKFMPLTLASGWVFMVEKQERCSETLSQVLRRH